MKVGRERKSTVITVGDVERVGVEKIAEMALEIAWKGAKAVYLSFDIDVIDAGFVPGTGWPEPGGLLPREALNLVKMVSEPGLAGIEVVECSPPYDWAEQTALMSSRVILDSLAAQVRSGKLGNKAAALDRVPPGGRRLRRLSSMRIALAQILSGTEPTANLGLVEDYTRRAADAGAQLVLFPEATMCRFGVPLAPIAEPLDGAVGIGVRDDRRAGGHRRRRGHVRPRRDDGRVTNTLIATGPRCRRALRQDPPLRRVRLRRVEHRRAGPRARRHHGRRGRDVGLTLCYDVRFPELYVELAQRGAQLITVHASWGTGPGKLEQWTLLARARAIDTTASSPRSVRPTRVTRSRPSGRPGSAAASSRPRWERSSSSAGADPQLLVTDIDLDAAQKVRETDRGDAQPLGVHSSR